MLISFYFFLLLYFFFLRIIREVGFALINLCYLVLLTSYSVADVRSHGDTAFVHFVISAVGCGVARGSLTGRANLCFIFY